MMKRIFTLCVVLMMLIAALAACGTTETDPEETPSETPQTTPDIYVPDEVEVVLWVPDDSASYLVEYPTTVSNDAQGLIDGLIELNVLPEGTTVLSFRMEDDGETVEQDGVASHATGTVTGYLDLSQAFGDAMNSTGSTGEFMMMASVVNTFLGQYGMDALMVTVEGEILETGHSVYDQAQTEYIFTQENPGEQEGQTQAEE